MSLLSYTYMTGEYGRPAPIIKEEPLEPPESLLVIRSPVSTNSRRAQRQLADIQTKYPHAELDVFPTIYDPDKTKQQNRADNQQRFRNLVYQRAEKVDPDRLWIIPALGDGGVGDLAEELIRADEPIRRIPFFPLAGGNGNDISSMAHGYFGKHNPARALPLAHLCRVHPVEATLSRDDAQETYFGLGYISFGMIAEVAQRIDADRGHWQLIQKIREKYIAFRGLQQAETFTITENGESRAIVDRIFPNGNRMAKIFHWPVELEDSHFLDVEIQDHRLMSLLYNAGKIACGQVKGIPILDGKQVAFTIETPTKMQINGEMIPVAAGTTATVQRSERYIRMVHLRPYDLAAA